MIYVRCNDFHERPPRSFAGNIIEEFESCGDVKNFVIDLRDNPGGAPVRAVYDLMAFIIENRDAIDDVYVVINRRTASYAVITAATIKTQIERVTLIGEPAGQPPNIFFQDVVFEEIQTHDLKYRVSRILHRSWPGYEYDALMPDIHIPHLFSDVLIGYDAVLHYIESN